MTDAHVLIAGDSNALGYLNTGPAPYAPTAQVLIWTGSSWGWMLPGFNTGTPNNPGDWGPEVQFANDWLGQHQGDGSRLWIVKDAATVKGGTTLAADWSPTTGHWFASTANEATAAMHSLDGSRFAFDHYEAAVIVLGENDAVVPAYAQAYGANLAAFDAAARSAWHVTDLIEPRIEGTMGQPADNLAVRQAQWAADQADDRLVTFKTIGFTQQPDHVHFDAPGHISLGHAAYEGWATF